MLLTLENKEIILASASEPRQKMLKSAGVDFRIEVMAVDEASIRDAGRAEKATVIDVATVLAETKALRVSQVNPEALVIGADQILDCQDKWFNKPTTRQEAAATLKALSGQTHQLVTAAVVFQDGMRLWHHCASPSVSMRILNDLDIENYLDVVSDTFMMTPGVYQTENLGAQILTRIDGCPYAVLGLPLLELLAFLREHGLGYR